MPITVAFSQQRSITMMLQSRRATIEASAERRLIEFLSQAQKSVDIAAYDLRSRAVLEALELITKRVRVRIILDAGNGNRIDAHALDPKPGTTVEAVADAGLAACVCALYANGKRAMHHKFAIRDNAAVWTGGMNFTDGGLHLEDASAIVLESEALAECYTAEFERLLSGSPHTQGAAETVTVGKGHRVTPLFGADIKAAVLKTMDRNMQRLRLMAYAVSDADVLQRLRSVLATENDVRGLYDPHGMQAASASGDPAASGAALFDDQRFLRVPSNRFNRYGEQNAFAHKALIVNDTVFLGSWNFSDAFDTVDDNVLCIDSPQVSTAMTRYFDAVTTRYRSYAQETWGG